MKMLLSDRDPVSRLLLTRALCASGHQVVLAEDGLQAWDVLQRENPPSVAILDSALEGMSSEDICQALRGRPDADQFYVLLLEPSGALDPERVIYSGADDCLPRPVDPGTLQARLKIAMRTLVLNQRCRTLESAKPAPDRDPATGIWSRSAVLELLSGQFARSTRDGISLAVVLADMDNFEALEASFGRAASESVVQQSVKRIADSIRPYDLLGRFSAEEFLIVAPDCTMSSALSLAERLRALIADQPFDIGDKAIQASASFGLATTAETGALDEDGLLRSADSALYTAKERGRNRVEVAKRIPRQHISNQPRFALVSKAREVVQ